MITEYPYKFKPKTATIGYGEQNLSWNVFYLY